MNRIIGLDVDDVIANLVETWIDIYNTDFNDSLKREDITSWNISEHVKCGDRIYDYLKERSLYDRVMPISGSNWGVRNLRKMGFNIVFITNSTPEQSGRKYFWLKDFGFILNKSEYFEAADKSLIACDWLIDDNPTNIANAYGKGIVYHQPWNKGLDKHYTRVFNWEDIVRYFVRVKNTMEIIGV